MEEALLIFKQMTIQCTGKMDFKAVPIQLTVDLCQPSVLPTHCNP